MKSRHFPLALAAAICLTFLPNPPSAEAAETTVSFRTLSWQGDISGIYIQSPDGEPQEVKASDYVRSLPYRTPAGADLVFFELEMNAEGEQVRKPVGRIPMADLANNLLVIITRTPEGYTFSSFPEDSKSFPDDSYRFMNATDQTLSARVGEEIKNIPPRSTATLKPRIAPDQKGMVVQMALGSRLVYSNRLAIRANQRTLIIATESGNPNNPIQAKRIVEGTQKSGGGVAP